MAGGRLIGSLSENKGAKFRLRIHTSVNFRIYSAKSRAYFHTCAKSLAGFLYGPKSRPGFCAIVIYRVGFRTFNF